MMVPDYSLIAEIMLFAEGFDDAKTLSRKMTRLYKLCSEQLSQQCHYDYGMRALKSVLVMAGSLKRANADLSEDVVLIRAMRDSSVPKFLADDVPLFFGILSDLFPGVEVPYQDTGSLVGQLERSLASAGRQVVPDYIKKIVQLYETMQVRFGSVLVGPTGGGKTVAYSTLASALGQLRAAGSPDENHTDVVTNVLNPKSINELSQEWTDGLASALLRTDAADPSPARKWTVFDGPVDAIWIESMNTVLDDNMTLCLANGERIKLNKSMKLLFEVRAVENEGAAMPA
jgi:dynein heavy chain, axonemal